MCKAKILVSRTLSTRHFYCLRFSLFCFRLKSSIRNKTGTHVFWENGVDYPRVSPGAHPLAKKPEDSGYEIDIKQIDSMLRWVCFVIDHRRRENVVRTSVKNSDIYVMAGAHHPERATYLFSCNGVFTSKVIFRLNFPLMRLPQEPDDQLQEIKLTS